MNITEKDFDIFIDSHFLSCILYENIIESIITEFVQEIHYEYKS